MKLTALNKEISQRLQPLRDALAGESVLVRSLPKEAQKFVEAYTEGGIEIIFPEARGLPPEDSGGKVQEAEIVLLVRIELGKRYGESDLEKAVYEWVVEQIIGLLIGFKPIHATSPLNFDRYNLYPPREGNWQVELRFTFESSLSVITPDQVTPEPLVKIITATDQLGKQIQLQ